MICLVCVNNKPPLKRMGVLCASLKIGTDLISPSTFFSGKKALIDFDNLIKLKDCEIITTPLFKVIGVCSIRCAINESGATAKISIIGNPEVPTKLFRCNHLNAALCLPLYDAIKFQGVQPSVCQFIKWHNMGRFYVQMNYNMCNN